MGTQEFRHTGVRRTVLLPRHDLKERSHPMRIKPCLSQSANADAISFILIATREVNLAAGPRFPVQSRLHLVLHRRRHRLRRESMRTEHQRSRKNALSRGFA